MLTSLLNWFKKEKRDLPWRKDKSPYKVLVSEVMLQQTQALVVIPYFLKWVERFPTLEALAAAPEEEVMKLWEGLGYYSRARGLHNIAKQLIESGKHSLPETEEELLKLKGIGPYTAAAILSFAHQKRAAAVDGNVLRVLSRLTLFQEEIDHPKAVLKIRQKTLALLPEKDPHIAMEALIELGATVCKKKPLCERCPLAQECLALKEGKEELLPLKRARPKTTHLKREILLIRSPKGILVRRVPKGEIMEGLYEFPYTEEEPHKLFSMALKMVERLPMESHSFTRYRAKLFPALYETESIEAPHPYLFVSKEELLTLPFSSGHRRVLSRSFKYL